MQDLAKLSPVFSKEGTVTAGNSSGITDGAARWWFERRSDQTVRNNAASPYCRLRNNWRGSGDHGDWASSCNSSIARKTKTQSRRASILIELNEAFAAQVIACDRELGFDNSRLNVNGGAIALGPPDWLYRRSHYYNSAARNGEAERPGWASRLCVLAVAWVSPCWWSECEGREFSRNLDPVSRRLRGRGIAVLLSVDRTFTKTPTPRLGLMKSFLPLLPSRQKNQHATRPFGLLRQRIRRAAL